MNGPAPVDTLLVFLRPPRPGSVKTRLAASIGDAPAAAFYRRCAEHTFDELDRLPSCRIVACVDPPDAIEDVRAWIARPWSLEPQRGETLGDRLAAAFDAAFREGAKRAVVVGTDIPNLTAEIIAQAFRSLESMDVVIGPALDGGYYLLGLTAPRDLFSNIAWSTNGVARETEARVRTAGLSIARLEPLEDVDTFEAYERHSTL